MKRFAGMLAVVLLWASLPTSLVMADNVKVGDTIGIWYGPYPTSEGPFRILGADADFLTFCVETHEYFYPTDWNPDSYLYKVASIGRDVDTDPDSTLKTLSPQAAYLYYHFRLGDLPGLALDAGVLNQLQSAIWYWEQEIGGDGGNQFGTSFFNGANAPTPEDINFAYERVQVLNPVYLDRGAPAQSYLTLQPAPEPATFVLLGLGIAAMALAVRRNLT